MPPSITSLTSSLSHRSPRLTILTITSAPQLLRHPQIIISRRYAVPPAPKKKIPPPAELFNLSHIPLSSFTSIIASSPTNTFPLPPSEYYACAQQFSSRLQRTTNPWSLSSTCIDLKKSYPPDLIHATACILRSSHQPPSSDALATALWLFASDSSHRPSTLSLARYLILSRSFGKLPPLKRLESRFHALVSTARDPDALTAHGEMMLLQHENPSAAARAFARALSLADQDSGEGFEFEWMPYCKLGLARAYLQAPGPGRGRDEAQKLLGELADQGMVEAHVELVELLGGKGEEVEKHMFEAAFSGRRGMYSRLAEMSLERAAGGGSAEKEEALRWAAEWSRLGDPKAEH